MSQMKRNIDRAAWLLDVPADEVTEYVMNASRSPFPGDWSRTSAGRHPYTARVYEAGVILDVHPSDLAAWLDARRAPEPVDPPPIGAARFIDPADDGCCAALDDVRDLVEAWRNGDLTPHDAMDSIARRTEL